MVERQKVALEAIIVTEGVNCNYSCQFYDPDLSYKCDYCTLTVLLGNPALELIKDKDGFCLRTPTCLKLKGV
ncbi:MAG: hypothetical protein EOL98_14145 [Negativicutes bacterium]|nr:hypothetical protein [Negativicutes bacterium]